MLKRDTKMRCRVISACYLFIIYNLVSGSGAGARNTELSAAKSWITQPYTHIRALKILSRPIQIQIQIIFIQHQLKQRCTTPHNLTKNISKLVLRNLNGLGSYLKPNTKLYRSCQNDNI